MIGRAFGPRGAGVLYGSIIVSCLAGSIAPTPLYASYQAAWGFGPITVTAVFGVYGLAVLAGLLVLGRLSDHVGRRPVVLAALAAQVVAMVVYAAAGGLTTLVAARVVQGLSAGAAMAALGGALLDADRERGAVINAVAPGVGSACGALLSGLLVAFGPAPAQLVYLVLLGVFVLQAAALAWVRETVDPVAGARRSLRPELRAPAPARPAIVVAAPVLFATWALPGFYGSLGPSVMRELVGSPSPLWGGVGVFVLTAAAAIGTFATRGLAPPQALRVGVGLMAAGLAVVVAGVGLRDVVVFLLGTAVTGAGFGTAFQGGIRLVVPFAPADARAATMAVLYVVAYLGISVPGVVAGAAVVALDGTAGVTAVAQGYAVGVIALGIVAVLLLRRSGV